MSRKEMMDNRWISRLSKAMGEVFPLPRRLLRQAYYHGVNFRGVRVYRGDNGVLVFARKDKLATFVYDVSVGWKRNQRELASRLQEVYT